MDDYIEIAHDFKFTEEIFNRTSNNLKLERKNNPFDIIFEDTKKCNPPSKSFINNTPICKQCYYQEFAKKMINVRISKREDFIIYQMNLRKEKYKFLNELEEMVIDNEVFFNNQAPGLGYDFRELLILLKSNYEPTNKNDINTTLDNNSHYNHDSKNIFISHSSDDSDIAEKLISLLKDSLNIKPEHILCTSVQGHKLTGGQNVDEALRSGIIKSKVIIGIISDVSLQSMYVLFELGAAWGLKKNIKPVFYNTKVISNTKPPLKNLHLMNLSNRSEVQQLIEEISEILHYNVEKASVYEKSLSNLIELINSKNASKKNESKTINENIESNITDTTSSLILQEVLKDTNYSLNVSRYKGGLSFNTNNKNLCTDHQNISSAEWENSLLELVEKKLIRPINDSNTRFLVTNKGIKLK